METCASNQARAIILNYGQLKSLFESLILVSLFNCQFYFQYELFLNVLVENHY